MMSEETFYSKVRDSLHAYAPEVPASIYSRMRKKLWLANFLALDFSRLNLWYLLVATGLAAGVYYTAFPESSSAFRGAEFAPEVSAPTISSSPITGDAEPASPVSEYSPKSPKALDSRQHRSAELTSEAEINDSMSPVKEHTHAEDNQPSDTVGADLETAPAAATPPKGKVLKPKIYREK